MALPASGPISLSQVNIELGLVSTAEVNLSDVAVRALFGVASGAIRLGGDGHGKSSAFAAAITSNQTNLNLRTFAVNAGWNQSSPATITVNAGVYVYATSTGNAGLTIDGSWPGGVTVVNNGFIIGMGGEGGGLSDISQSGATNGNAGGPALALGTNVKITNNSYIAGGGGGGAGVRGNAGFGGFPAGGGGGAGGGAGGSYPNLQWACFGQRGGTGGSGGEPGLAGGSGTNSGGGGGRILPGDGGSNSGGGGGSGGGGFLGVYSSNLECRPGGDATSGGGGGWGAAGGRAGIGARPPGAGGSGNSAGGNGAGTALGAGGAGGQAIQRNGFTATTSGAGTTYGAIS